MKVDFEEFEFDQIAKDHGVSDRATLIMLRQGKEVGRVLWDTSRDAIEGLFQAAVGPTS